MAPGNEQLRILHTGGHPGDAFDMVGGTLAHHIRQGDQVTVVVMSHGVRSHALRQIEDRRHAETAVAIEPAIEQKEQEVVAACGLLGITDVRFMRNDDHLLLPEAKHIMGLARLIQDLRPHVVTTHSPFEPSGTTHRACHEITMHAIGTAAGVIDEDRAPHRVAEVFFAYVQGETCRADYITPRFPEILIDVTDVAELKLQALQRIGSQYYDGDFGRKMLECINGIHGLHRCVPYCETFLRHVPQVATTLPVSQHNLDLAAKPLSAIYSRMGHFVGTSGPRSAEIEKKARDRA